MCGIYGAHNLSLNHDAAQRSLRHRGCDATNTYDDDLILTHHLHAVNNHVEQPFSQPLFATNCEIYNADSLGDGANDAAKLHDHLGTTVTADKLDELDGVYAIAHATETTITLARDLLGVKPLWYYHGDDGLAFASERKALLKAGLPANAIRELHPRHILRYDTETHEVQRQHRGFDLITQDETLTDEDKAADVVLDELRSAVEKRIPPSENVALLFSGGIDSAIIARLLDEHGADITAYYAGVPGSDEEQKARRAADDLGLNLTTQHVDVDGRVEDVAAIIDDTNYVKLSVALTFDAACDAADENVVMSGTGAEELFGGYNRMGSSNDVNNECRSRLRRKYITDLYRDDTVTMHHGLELRVPFLDHDVVKEAMSIPHDVKSATTKQVLRDVAARLDLPSWIIEQGKRAAQYGSGTARALQRLASENDEHVGDYLAQRCDQPNFTVTTLLSTGKDSCLATQRMLDYNYDITSFTTIKPEAQHSWMSHDANTDIARLQAKAANKPLTVVTSSGEQDIELDDYEDALRTAREDHGVDGVVTGAVASEYQRQRIERICDRVGLKPYAPLWHTPGEAVIKQVLKRGFDVIIEKTAAAGFDDTWPGRHIEPHVLDELRSLNDTYGVHVAGEGGEFETVVLDAPFFEQRITIEDASVVSEDEHTHQYVIEDASLSKS